MFCPLVQMFTRNYSDNIKNSLIIDIREPYEYEGFSLAGSINLPLSANGKEEIQKFIDESQHSEIIIFCFCGKRSKDLHQTLDCKYRIISKVYEGGIYKYKKKHRL